jgi:hypothetical protein
MSAEQVWDSLVALASHEPDARDLQRDARDDRRIQISHMVCDAYLNYDGKATVDLGYASLANETAIQAREKAARELEIEAKRRGDKTREIELRREIGKLERERNEAYVRDFLTPLIANLARTKTGADGGITVDENYKMNANPAVFAVETWRKMHVPGYGPPPRTSEQTEADLNEERQRLGRLAAQLKFPQQEHANFIAYCEKSRTEWMRASELDSPAPRGHFLRTMGQSDRDFIENANPNASIPQALTLMNGDLISKKGILSPYSPLVHGIAHADDKIEAVYLALLARPPASAEKAKFNASLTDESDAVSALVYAILNTKQFIFIQ